MPDNRLYIANKETKECRCISKSGDHFRKLNVKDLELLNEIIITDNSFSKKTDLILFTESDDYWYSYFMEAKDKLNTVLTKEMSDDMEDLFHYKFPVGGYETREASNE